MSTKSNLVNLDAMIKREDFAASEKESNSFENVSTISLRDLTHDGGLIGHNLRKPDFQRETCHWSPEQVVSLLECFLNGDLIPSVILWQSPTYLFVIDGGHRLSVLKAWISNDYGDGPASQAYFGYNISLEQKKAAEKTRKMVDERVGTWQHLNTKLREDNADASERKKISAMSSRGIPIQWVKGDADKAESSFFKINTKGTPLDGIEELLLEQRKKPVSIASRAIIRAGQGHKYWSSFAPEVSAKIEIAAKSLHSILFDPEIKNPIKTLDLPLGGPKGVRTALEALIELNLIAIRDQKNLPKDIKSTLADQDGQLTIEVLNKTLRLAQRVSGNDRGSLGLHPAVYFYGPSGRHSVPMFLGTMTLIGRKIANNDKTFFSKFTSTRSKLEAILVDHKDLIATILQKMANTQRVERYSRFLDTIITSINDGNDLSEADLAKAAGFEGKIVLGESTTSRTEFTDETKSQLFIRTALGSAIRCPICNGYLDPTKSVQYDHVAPVRSGGKGHVGNAQLTHPYCNQSAKEQAS